MLTLYGTQITEHRINVNVEKRKSDRRTPQKLSKLILTARLLKFERMDH